MLVFLIFPKFRVSSGQFLLTLKQVDATASAEVEACVKQVVAEFGRVDGAANCVGKFNMYVRLCRAAPFHAAALATQQLITTTMHIPSNRFNRPETGARYERGRLREYT